MIPHLDLETVFGKQRNSEHVRAADHVESKAHLTCDSHQKPLELICNTCKEHICLECALFFSHRGHVVKWMKEKRGIRKNLSDEVGKLSEEIEELLNIDFVKEASENFKTGKSEIESVFEELTAKIVRTKEACLKTADLLQEDILKKATVTKEKLSHLQKTFKETPEENLEDAIKATRKQLQSIDQPSLTVEFKKDIYGLLEHFCRLTLQSQRAPNESKDKEDSNILQESLKDSGLAGSLDLNGNAKREHSESTKPSSVKTKKIHSKSPKVLNSKQFSIMNSSQGQAISQPIFQKLKNNIFSASIQMPNNFLNTFQKSSSIYRGHELDSRESILYSDRQINNRYPTINSKIFKPNSSPRSLTPKSCSEMIPKVCINLSKMQISSIKIDEMIRDNFLYPTTRTLKLNENSLTTRSIKNLLKYMIDFRVETLFLNNNNITEASLDYFLSFTKYNGFLRAINIQGNNIDYMSGLVQAKLAKLRQAGVQVLI